MTPIPMTIRHTINSTGVHSEISYYDADGSPLLARLPFKATFSQAVAWLTWCRANDGKHK
jgi:hypothetical protein